MLSISDRSLSVLHAIVNDFVSDGEPVGSKTIAQRHSFGVSAATIRNDMALLEGEDLIVAPHTSSGRIPTDKGYRLYLDTLANIRPITQAQRNAIERFLGESENLDDVMSRTVRLLARLTNQVAVVQYPSADGAQVKQVELIALSEERLLCVLIMSNGVVEQQVIRLTHTQVDEHWVQTVRNMLAETVIGYEISAAKDRVHQLITEGTVSQQPGESEAVNAVLRIVEEQLLANEDQRIAVAGTANLSRTDGTFESLSAVLEAVEEQVVLLRLIQELVTDVRGLGASIGRENIAYGLPDAALIATPYQTGGHRLSRLGILGPTRMDYQGNIAAMRAVSRYLGQMLDEQHL